MLENRSKKTSDIVKDLLKVNPVNSTKIGKNHALMRSKTLTKKKLRQAVKAKRNVSKIKTKRKMDIYIFSYIKSNYFNYIYYFFKKSPYFMFLGMEEYIYIYKEYFFHNQR